MIYTTLDNFYLSSEQLENSPSRQQGIDAETETTLRFYACDLIQEAGLLLKCPQAVMATGQVLLHRCYCKKSMREYHIKRMAATCFWLATKLEEAPRRTRDIIMCFDRIIKRRENRTLTVLEVGNKEFEEFRQGMIRYERHLLRTFGFVMHVEHPHKFLLSYCNLLETSEDFKQMAWNYVNDSLRTTLCVRFKSEVVACAAIFLAGRKLTFPLPESVPWWEVFSVETDQLVEAVKTLHDLYQRPKPEFVEIYKDVNASAKPTTPLLELNNSPQVQDSVLQSNITAGKEEAVTEDVRTEQQKSGKDADTVSTAHQNGTPPGPQPKELQSAGNQDEAETGLKEVQDDDAEARKSRKRSRSRESDRRERETRDGTRDDRKVRDRDVERTRDKERERDRDRDGKDKDYRDRDRDRERRHRNDRDRDRDRGRDRDRSRDRGRPGDEYRRDRGHRRDRSRSPYSRGK